MKYTLLEIVQAVLLSIDGDEVNSITDTTEARQVTALVKRCYGNLAGKLNYPERKSLFGLTSGADSSKPTLMYMPVGSYRTLEWVKYDCRTAQDSDSVFQPCEFVDIQEFFNRMHPLNPSEDNSLTTFTHNVNGQNVQFIVRNDVSPSYYTSWDDYTIIFNSYDNEVDTTLQSSKTLCFGEAVLPWSQIDSYVIPIDDHQLLLNESIALAWAELKQAQNVKAEREARNQLISSSRDKQAIIGSKNYDIQLPHYGRKR